MFGNELNAYPEHFIYKSNSCKKSLIQQISKAKKSSKVKCSTESISDPKRVISFINGHQIKDLHRITTSNSKPKKTNDVKISHAIVPSNKEIMCKLSKGKEEVSCNCPKNCRRSRTNQLNGVVKESRSKKTIGSQVKNDLLKQKTNHRKKNLREPEDDPREYYVLRSSQRLQYIYNMNKTCIEIDEPLVDKMTSMLTEPIDIRLDTIKHYTKSPVETSSSQSGVKCEWNDCTLWFDGVEDLTNHLKLSHLAECEKSDQCSCFWRECKFSNQSCSFKWLLKHVLRHCDLKPFKCVILGCDMTFSTQNGLARHVPTHFNENRVRRACVLTSEAARKDDLNRTKRQLSATLSTCSESSSSTYCSSSGAEQSIGENASKPDTFGVKRNNLFDSHRAFTTKTYNYVKKKIQKSTFNPSTNSGYLDKAFRIDHKVIGRRSGPNGTTEMLLTPSLNNLLPRSSFWCDGNDFRKRKHSHVEIPMKDMSVDVKNKLYDTEHPSSRRRSKKRK